MEEAAAVKALVPRDLPNEKLLRLREQKRMSKLRRKIPGTPKLQGEDGVCRAINLLV